MSQTSPQVCGSNILDGKSNRRLLQTFQTSTNRYKEHLTTKTVSNNWRTYVWLGCKK